MSDITQIYQDLFGRAPDADGMAYWTAKAPAIEAAGGEAGLRAQIAGTAAPADRAALLSSTSDPNSLGGQIASIYQSQFGRAPDADGFAYWLSKAPGIIANGGLGTLQDQIVGTAAPADASYNKLKHLAPGATNLTPSEATDWSNYMSQAAQQQQGMNHLPYVFADYGTAADRDQYGAAAGMFRTPEQQKAAMADVNALWGDSKSKTPYGFGGLGGLGGA